MFQSPEGAKEPGREGRGTSGLASGALCSCDLGKKGSSIKILESYFSSFFFFFD